MYGSNLKKVWALMCAVAFAVVAPAAMAQANLRIDQAEQKLDYVFFDTYPLMGPYFYSRTESKGPSWVMNLDGKLPVRQAPAYTPGSSIELRYRSVQGGKWKATITHRALRGQDPFDNGVFVQETTSPFKSPDVLHMRVKVDIHTHLNLLPQVSLLYKDQTESRSCVMAQYMSQAGADGWCIVRIPLSHLCMNYSEKGKKIRGRAVKSAEEVKGVVFSQEWSDKKQEENQIFVDQIDLRPGEEKGLNQQLKPNLLSVEAFERHVDLAWAPVPDDSVAGTVVERSEDGVNFVPVGFRAKNISRFADYTGEKMGKYTYRVRFLGYDDQVSPYSETRSATTRIMSDDELLSMVEEACARYYWDGAEPESGMTLESIPGDPHMVAIGASGFGIYSLVVAADRGFIQREQLLERLGKILTFLEKADRYHGAYGHYYDGRTGHHILFFGPDDDGGDLVETSFLMQGLLAARQYLKLDVAGEGAIGDRITKLWEAVEFDWYRQTPDGKYLTWHWSPDKLWKINHHLIGWNETMITYLLGIASPAHSVPPQLYYSGWASQEPFAQDYRGGGPGKMYSNGDTFFGKKLDVGGFSGSPLFFIHYNFLGMNPHGLRDKYTEYFENSKTIAEINLRYCQQNPKHHQGYGETGWGLTASDGPFDYSADEPREDHDKGKIAPTGAVSSMPYVPAESMKAMKAYYRDYGKFLWGEYGFRDAFDLDENWVSDLYMGLNQGPMVIMIENYRTGLPWKLFGSNPEIQKMRAAVFEPEQR